MARRSSTILIADDTEAMRELIQQCLESADLYSDTFASAQDLLKKINEETLVCVLDLNMPGMTGLDCLRRVKFDFPHVEVVMLTGADEARAAVTALRAGAFDYLTKPFNSSDLTRTVRKAMQLSRAAKDGAEVRQSVSDAGPPVDLLGDAPAMLKIKAHVARVAATEETVLITGESGTGKTLVARAIHLSSRRASGPFISVSCPSLPRDLLESEMFGHEKGAFSGAHQKRLGRVELAEGGTLFLDEIGELPLELQAKLLTFLQDRTFFRVGGESSLKASVRIIAATNQDLPSLIAEREFRQDLYFRLNVLQLEMPPLRARPDDIRIIAGKFLENFAARNRFKKLVLTAKAMELLLNHGWPGNVRELENVLARAATMAGENGIIDISDLPGLSKHERTVASTVTGLAGLRLESIERMALQQTLAACGQNRAEAGRMLGVAEKTVYNMMRRLDLTSETISSFDRPVVSKVG